MNLNQVTLPVNNIKHCVDFYLTMGFTQIVDSPHYARFICPNRATFSLVKEKGSFNNKVVIYFESNYLDAWVKQLQNRGMVFEQLPKDEACLWREAILKDPSGNKLKLYWAGINRVEPPWKVSIKLENETIGE